MKKMMADIRPFLNYDSIRKNIIYRFINTEQGRTLLEDLPHIEFLDLSVIFECVVSQEETCYASLQIHNTHMKLWDVTVAELYQEAKKNTPRIMPYELKNMEKVLCEITEAENPEEFDYDRCMAEFEDSVPMYVLGNKKGWEVRSACCIPA